MNCAGSHRMPGHKLAVAEASRPYFIHMNFRSHLATMEEKKKKKKKW